MSNADEQLMEDLLNDQVVLITGGSKMMHSADMLRLIGLLEELLVGDKSDSASNQSVARFSETADLVKTVEHKVGTALRQVDHGLNVTSLEQAFAQARSLLIKTGSEIADSIFYSFMVSQRRA